MQAGRRNTLVTLTEPTTSRNSYGEVITAHEAFAQEWAEVAWVGSKERFQADRLVAVRAATVRLRPRDDVSEQTQVEIGGAAYQITGLRELGTRGRDGLEIAVERIV